MCLAKIKQLKNIWYGVTWTISNQHFTFYFRESIESDMTLHSTFILIKHRVVPMDLVLVEQLNTRIYSFLSVSWGLFADIDYESEKYRAIGEARFTLQAVKRILGIIFMKKYLFFNWITFLSVWNSILQSCSTAF